jgi:uncharacterized protein (TIRG00374 family)
MSKEKPSPSPAASKGWSITRSSLVWRFLLVLALSIGSMLLLLTLTGGPDLLSQLPRVQLGWFILAGSISAITWILDALANWFLLRGIGARLPFGWTLMANLGANLVSYLTPFMAGGPPFFMFLLSRRGISPGASAMVVTARLTLSAIIFSVLFPVFLILFRRGISWSETWQKVLNVPFYLLGALVLLIALFLLWRRIPGSYHRFISGWPMRVLLNRERFAKYWYWLLSELSKMKNAARTLLTLGWPSLLGAALAIVVYWVAFYSVAPVLLDSLAIPHPFLETFLGQAVLNALVSLSPTPGGSGASELGLATLFSTWVPSPLLGLFTALWRFLIYYLTLAAGGICFLVLAWRERFFNLPRRHL